MLAGLLIALAGLLMPAAPALPAHVVARVDGQDILRRDVERAIAGARQSRRQPLSRDEERAILQRLIDEQLLLSYGLDMDLVRLTPQLRKQTVDTVLELLRAEARQQAPSDQELQDFLDENAAYFSRAPKLRLRVYRAEQAAPLHRLREELLEGRPPSLAPDPALPQALLPMSKLHGLLGPRLTQAAADLSTPGPGEVLALDFGHALLELLEAKPARSPTLDEIRPRVEAEWRRRQGEERFEALLSELRERYPVQLAPL